jgi:hypothetical protein
MIWIASALLCLPVLIVALLDADGVWNLSAVGTSSAVLLIIAFAIAAVGWTIRRDV